MGFEVAEEADADVFEVSSEADIDSDTEDGFDHESHTISYEDEGSPMNAKAENPKSSTSI